MDWNQPSLTRMYTSDARLYHPVSTQRVTVSVQATEEVGATACAVGPTSITTSGLFRVNRDRRDDKWFLIEVVEICEDDIKNLLVSGGMGDCESERGMNGE